MSYCKVGLKGLSEMVWKECIWIVRRFVAGHSCLWVLSKIAAQINGESVSVIVFRQHDGKEGVF